MKNNTAHPPASPAPRSVVITGVSSGIGWGATKVLIDHGIRVFGSVRKQSDADRLSLEFGSLFSPLILDITDESAIRSAAAQVEERIAGMKLWGLVNNAGIAVPGPLLDQPLAQFRQQLEVNLVGQLAMIQAFAPSLGTEARFSGAPGRIVNISSVGGKIGPPFLGAYAAAKHALEGLSESLRRELMLYGIDVIIVAPGSIATPIWDKAEGADLPHGRPDYAEAMTRFKTHMIAEGRKGYKPERVGEVIWTALSSASPSTRYAVVPGKLMNWVLPRLLPSRFVDRLIAKQLGLTYRHTAPSVK
jgi:NAD(P)-dependent dehydrogenase (short-subunit alcohol dehydrogenase family)